MTARLAARLLRAAATDLGRLADRGADALVAVVWWIDGKAAKWR